MAKNFLARTKEIGNLLKEYERIKDFEKPELYFKPHFRKICQRIDTRSSGAGNLLGVSEVRDAYSFCKDFSNKLRYREPKKLGRKYARASAAKFTEAQIQTMVQFQSKLVDHGIPKIGFPIYEQFKIVRLHKTLEEQLP